MKYKVEYEIEFDEGVREESFDKGQKLHGTRYGVVGGYMFRIPKDAKVERVEEAFPRGIILRSADGIIEWKGRDGLWYYTGTYENSAKRTADLWDDNMAQDAIDEGSYEIIYKPEA